MSKIDSKKKVIWYESANTITTIIIGLIVFTVLCSQSFAIVGSNSFRIFSSVINHNIIHLLILIYFVLIKTHVGKKYFNYLNVFLVFIYFLSTVTSFLTLIQSFALSTIFSLLINVVLLIYLFHTMFRDTSLWKEFKLGKSPFNEISNDSYNNCIMILATLSLIVNLISTVVVSGLVISFLDAIYILCFSRYIYLYRSFLDEKGKDINNEGNFDAIKKELSDDLNEVVDVIGNVTETVKGKTTEFIKDNEIDNKVDDIKKKVNKEVSKIKNTGKDKKNNIKNSAKKGDKK